MKQCKFCQTPIGVIMDPQTGEIYYDPSTNLRVWLCPGCCRELSDRVVVDAGNDILD